MSEQKFKAPGTSVMRAGNKVVVTVSDEAEAELLERALRDEELVAFLELIGAMRSGPGGRRFRAGKLLEALAAVAEAIPVETNAS